MKGARQLGDAHGVQGHQDDEDACHGKQQRDDRHALGSYVADSAGQQLVPAHRQRIARSAQDACVRHGDESEQGRDRDEQASPPAIQYIGRSCRRRKVARKAFDGNHTHHYRRAETVYQDGGGQGKEHAQGKGLLRFFDFFRKACDLGYAHVADVDHTGRPHERSNLDVEESL